MQLKYQTLPETETLQGSKFWYIDFNINFVAVILGHDRA
jgi:hypothetical protein